MEPHHIHHIITPCNITAKFESETVSLYLVNGHNVGLLYSQKSLETFRIFTFRVTVTVCVIMRRKNNIKITNLVLILLGRIKEKLTIFFKIVFIYMKTDLNTTTVFRLICILSEFKCNISYTVLRQ